MNDDFEFTQELDEAVRKEQQDDSLLDVAEAVTSVKDDLPPEKMESVYDMQGADTVPSELMESDLIDGEEKNNIDNSDGELGDIATKDSPPDNGEAVDQGELNNLVFNVTDLGADESVLGRERLLEAFKEAEEKDEKGGSYVEGFTSAVERMMGIRLDTDSVDRSETGQDISASADDDNGAKERFQYHKERYEAQLETVSPWPKDTVNAYHRMAMTYNAYLAGEKIRGIEVTKADVFVSGLRFYQSNIFETAIIRSLRFAGDLIKEKYDADKVEVEQNATEKEQIKVENLRDEKGAFDYGDASSVSVEDVKSVRQSIKEYGFDYGLDSTRGQDSYVSTDNVRITKPTDFIGRLDIGNGKTVSIPGVRMVEIDGNRGLITPDGKVVHESTRFRERDGFRLEDISRIEKRCDAFESRTIHTEIEQMAERRGVSIDSIKSEYAEKAMEAYASRVENTMLGEANRLERQTIPEAREELNSFREDIQKLNRIEVSLGNNEADVDRGISKTELSDLKVSLQNAAVTLENRISAMEARVDLLRDTHAQVDTSSIKERFECAANSEEQAVGRGGRIEYISNDTDKRLADVIDAGTDRVLSDVERFNEANPEMHLTYDVDDGKLYNHFGVSDSGTFNPDYATVDANELPSDNPEAIRDYIAEHSEDDFDQFDKFLDSADSNEMVEGEQITENDTTVTDGTQPGGAVENANTEKEDEIDAKIMAGVDDDANAVQSEHEPSVGEAGETADEKKNEYADKIRELFADYLEDSEKTISLEEDIQSSLADLTAEAGADNFNEAMNILSDIVKGMDQLQPDQLERIANLVHAVADISAVPADAIDSFQESIRDVDFADELIAEIGKPEIMTPEFEVGVEAQVTIGDEQLSVGENGIHDAVTGVETGGFKSDGAADQYLEDASQALFDYSRDVDSGYNDVDIEKEAQHELGSLHDTLEEIGGDTVAADDNGLNGISGVDSGAEAGGVEAGEVAGDAAVDAAVESGIAGSAALL